MGFWSSVWSGVTSAVSTAVDVGARVISKAREVAGQALTWMAEKAEGFVGTVKEVWERAKPFIENVIRPGLKLAAKWAATNLPTFPWVSTALTAFDKALGALLVWDQSDLAKKVEAAIKWAISKAKNLREAWMGPAEAAEAEEHESALREARSKVRGEAAQGIDLALLISQYAQLATGIKDVLENNAISDFQHYLRLRAAQKLLSDTEQRLIEAQDISAIDKDDLFLTEMAAELLKAQPQISDIQTQQLDEIILQRFGKKLIPFVFEELIISWGINLGALEKEWKKLNDNLAKKKVEMRRLETSQRLAELSTEEVAQLNKLKAELPKLTAKMDQKRKQTSEMRNYVFAAEGFLQMLEKEPEEFVGKEYMLEDSATVGMLIIDCAQHGKRWESLSADEQALIIDFANIFEEDSRARTAQVVEVTA
ncbi:hypothetical protein EQ826_12550 [Ectopseudomonas mendocina]|nr:hypothetical protein [Pseudomonas mendocina]TRO25846.1 hypothetical protein EQ828_02865 [Pseudomonas mendocina]TRO25985.1 hypothetical protein EQ826_12550 [Pseudomonas mendocina]